MVATSRRPHVRADYRHRTTIGRAQRPHRRTHHRHEVVSDNLLALWLALCAFLFSVGETTAAMVLLLAPFTIGLLVTIACWALFVATEEGEGSDAH